MTPVHRHISISNFDISQDAEALARVIESSVQVQRRYQFFVWSQSKLGALVPHHVAVCGLYQRATKEMRFEAFNSISVPGPLLNMLTDPRSTLMQQLIGMWIEHRGRALVLDLSGMRGELASQESQRLMSAGFSQLLVHGVARPDRPAELESFFIFTSTTTSCTEAHQFYLEMLLPYLHRTYLRAHATERELVGLPPVRVPVRATRATQQKEIITDRERQILSLVREGQSNQRIGEQLNISALTVKNHVQKILRKLDAVNRAQAVAKAMALELLDGQQDQRIQSVSA